MDTAAWTVAPVSERLRREQAEAFERDGFLSIPDITTPEEIARLREIYDAMFARRAGFEAGDYFDLMGAEEGSAKSPQITHMSAYEPALRQSALWRNARAIARQLMGGEADFMFEHGILKPPGAPGTPWHQDFAYYVPGERYVAITFWVPLQDVAKESGAMQFVPGSHKGPLYEHRPLDDDPRIHALEIVGRTFDREAVPCPLKAGGCTLHHHGVIHGTARNETAGPRRAYAVAFGVKTRRSVIRKDHPWNVRRQTTREERYLASLTPVQRVKRTVKMGLIRIGLY